MTITTVGYGDFVPVYENEWVYVIFLEISGLAAYSLIMGGILNVKSEKSLRKLFDE